MERKKDRQKLALRKAATRSTPSSRRHHFESFTQRLTTLKIDPIRRQRNRDDEYDSISSTTHFRTALDRWRDLNQSEDFANFARQVDSQRESFCDSLPQIIHRQNEIVDLLLQYIEKGTTVSVEPLLDLVSRLAQDLQSQFEKHFERTVTTIAALAAKHQDLEVIEWCFNCLTWLFKYLERLLISDLCPLYGLLAPYLGKERQRDFITRFVAESLSFLVKKASRNRDALSTFIKLALGDLCRVSLGRNSALYEHGIMTLFLEAIKGIQEHLHSKGDAIFHELLSQVIHMNDTDPVNAVPAVRVLRGVLGQVLHHTRSETFKPILDVLLEELKPSDSPESPPSNSRLVLCAELLLLVTGLRRGSRVVNWSPVLDILSSYISHISTQSLNAYPEAANEVLGVFAVAHQSCPLDVAISFTKTIEKICSQEWQHQFLGFCSLYSELGNDRFRSLLLPYFQRFIAKFWDGDNRGLCVLLPKLVNDGQLPIGSLKLPNSWTGRIADDFDQLIELRNQANPAQISYLNGMLEMMRDIPLDQTSEAKMGSQVHNALLRLLQDRRWNSLVLLKTLLLGNGLRYVASSSQMTQIGDLWPFLCLESAQAQNRPIFLQSILVLVRRSDIRIDFDSLETQTLVDSLMDSISSPSHELRLAALEILQVLVSARDGESSRILSTAFHVESTEPTIETARTMSMQIRNIAANYHTVSSDQWLSKAIPVFCFGLLHVKFSQIWEDACFALKEICNTKEGEQVVCETAFQWLEGCEAAETTLPPPAQSNIQQTDFVGASFQNLQTILRRNMALGTSADKRLESLFHKIHKEARLNSTMNRMQALKVLRNIPGVAEKRSRSLVPVLLAWAHRSEPIGTPDDSDGDQDTLYRMATDGSIQRWARKEQKSMLSLFALFTNPKVLYKSALVYSALLSLLEHGDIEIQKSALQAIFSWKNPSITRYEEDLVKLLDDAKFREQIAVFLDVGKGDSSLRDDDRAAAMPIILRLLYGRVTTRGKGDQHANRKAVFVLLSRFEDIEIQQFIGIALGSLCLLSLEQDGVLKLEELQTEFLSQRKQFGLLNMLKDLLDTWKSKSAPYASRLIDPVFYCLIRAVREMKEQEGESSSQNSLARSVRQVAIQCLNMLFDFNPSMNWTLYMPTLFAELINPRLENFAVETAQAPSALLRMFSTWSHAQDLAPFLTSYNPILLLKVAECIGHEKAKDEVKRFVNKEIICALITQAEVDQDESQELIKMVQMHASAFLDQLALLLRADPPKDLLEDSVEAVVRLSKYTTNCPAQILSSAAFLLQMPARRASHRVKMNLLKILLLFVPTLASSDEISNEIYTAICASFSYFTDKESRSLLSSIARTFAEQDATLLEVAMLCEDLNSFASGRLDEPDLERKSSTFTIINEERYLHFSARQWRLLLGNLMFYIKDEDDAIRRSASYSLRRFIEAASQRTGDEADDFLSMTKNTIISGIEKGLRDQPEDVQIEYLSVLAHAVKSLPDWSVVNDMKPLLAGDEEASFFTNIHHTQHHRRTRAMKRLTEKVKLGTIASINIYHIFVPLMERFIFDTKEGLTPGEEEVRAILTPEAIRTMGVLVEWVDWQQCRVLLRRFIGYVRSKAEMQDAILKLLDAITDAICRSAEMKTKASTADVLMEKTKDDHDTTPNLTKLANTMPGKEKMSQYLVQDVITPLSTFLHDKDESFVSRRIYVVVIVARFLQLLPDDEFQIRLPALLTDTCNILRSKDQGSRDMTRKALTTVCTLIGPSSVGFVLRELRSALQRGFYLHVLSFTLHSILETTTLSFKPGDLDYCASDVMEIIMEDIFGNTGKEKEAAEYLKDKNTKKEVKGKKSFDSIQLLATVTSLSHLVDLVRPIESILLGRVSIKDVRHIDELLRRIELGLLQNKSVRDRDVLVFCYEIIKDTQKITPAKGGPVRPPPSKYLGQKNQKVPSNSLRSSEAIGRLTRFSFELVRAVLRKHKSLQTPANIAGFMPIIGDALLSTQEDVKLASIRLFTAILNIPLPRIDSDAPVYIAEAARIIEDSATTNDELSQAALKLISAVLRERRTAPVKIKEKTLAVLLKKMKPDLQIISQQGVAFNLLRSIIARKIVIPEVYEVIDGDDGVAAISVRDHDRTTRDLARGVYFQFLMDYPQGKGRFAKQLTFLVRNLEYEHAEGRQSVMETLHLLLTKVGESLVQDIFQEACWPLVSVMVNDDSSDCREMAGGLVRTVFNRADDEWTKNFLALSRKMLENGTKDVQKRTALQCWTIYLEIKGEEAKDVTYVQKTVTGILDRGNEEFDMENWQLVYYVLHTSLVICRIRPDVAFGIEAQPLWESVQRYLSFPQSWVKQEAANLIGMYVADFATTNSTSLKKLPLVGSHSLKLDGKGMCDLTARNLRLLREGVSEELAGQAARNLAFLGKCFAANGIEWQRPNNNPTATENDEGDNAEESDDEETAIEPENAKETQSALQHLFYRLAGTIRRELRKPSDPSLALYRRADLLHPKTFSLKLLAALITTLPVPILTPSLPTIFLPLLHLTDASITAPTSQDTSFTSAYEDLVNNATEALDLLREKLGTTVYVREMQGVKKQMQAKRDERRIKRTIEKVSFPERAEKSKVRKRSNEKVRRREKSGIARGMRRGW